MPTVAVKRGHKCDSRQACKRGRSLPMALKARVGQPASRYTGSSVDASDIGVQTRPLALPVYRAGTNYNTRRQHLTGQHTDRMVSRNNNTASGGHRRLPMELEHRADNTSRTAQHCSRRSQLDHMCVLGVEAWTRVLKSVSWQSIEVLHGPSRYRWSAQHPRSPSGMNKTHKTRYEDLANIETMLRNGRRPGCRSSKLFAQRKLGQEAYWY